MAQRKMVALIGTGEMGSPIGKNILKNGYPLVITHHSKSESAVKRVNALEKAGALVAPTMKELIKLADIIITILPTGDDVEALLLSETFLTHVKPDTTILEMTSCEPATIINIHNQLATKAKQITLFDAPVSGGVKRAQTGTLTVLGAGDSQKFKALTPLLETFAKEVFYVGPLGAGKTLKAINQMLIAINTLGVIEGITLAKKHRVDMNIFSQVIQHSSGNSYAFENYVEKIVNEDFASGFKLALMKKDLETTFAIKQETPLPVLEVVYSLLKQGEEFSQLDFSAISKLYQTEDQD